VSFFALVLVGAPNTRLTNRCAGGFPAVAVVLSSQTLIDLWKIDICPMDVVIDIGDFHSSVIPPLEILERYFIDAQDQPWASGARFTMKGIDGTDNLAPSMGRVDAWLTIDMHPEHGFFLIYSTVGRIPKEQYYSLRDTATQENTGRLVEIGDNGEAVSEDFFVSGTTALEAVQFFLQSKGHRSNAINWIADEDVSEGAFRFPE
jgi:hypothetical protein